MEPYSDHYYWHLAQERIRGDGAVNDFDEIAETQGWNRYSMLCIVRDFVSSMGLGEQLDEYAQSVADEENA